MISAPLAFGDKTPTKLKSTVLITELWLVVGVAGGTNKKEVLKVPNLYSIPGMYQVCMIQVSRKYCSLTSHPPFQRGAGNFGANPDVYCSLTSHPPFQRGAGNFGANPDVGFC